MAELVYANVLDRRVYDAEGLGGQPLVYGFRVPGRPLPFVVARQWKAPQGVVVEQFELVAPSGTAFYRSPPVPRRMRGQMDLTEFVDVVEDCTFEELGVHVASFVIDGEVQGQVEFQLVLQQPPERLPKEIEDALRKSDVIWAGLQEDGRERLVPVWFAYQRGRLYVLHATDPSSPEQRVPGLPEAPELLVVTRYKGRDTRLSRFPAAVRVIPPASPEFAGLAAALADRRRDRHGPPGEAINAWKSTCVIAELTPNVPA